MEHFDVSRHSTRHHYLKCKDATVHKREQLHPLDRKRVLGMHRQRVDELTGRGAGVAERQLRQFRAYIGLDVSQVVFIVTQQIEEHSPTVRIIFERRKSALGEDHVSARQKRYYFFERTIAGLWPVRQNGAD